MRMKRQKRRLMVVPRSLSLLDGGWSSPFETSCPPLACASALFIL
jgi:hypothetical protein